MGAPRRFRRRSWATRAWAVAVVAMPIFAAGCAGDESDGGRGEESPTTLIEPNGRITIGESSFEFSMTCYAAGAGAVVAVGTGTEPGSGREVRALVQAFLGDAYVGVVVGDDEVVFEPTLDESIDLFIQDDVITGGAMSFVRTDRANPQGEPAGLGEVTVTCASYLQGAPPGYDE